MPYGKMELVMVTVHSVTVVDEFNCKKVIMTESNYSTPTTVVMPQVCIPYKEELWWPIEHVKPNQYAQVSNPCVSWY